MITFAMKQKHEERAALIAQSRQLLDHAEKEKRQLNDEENVKFDKMTKDIERLAGEIKTLKTAEDLREAAEKEDAEFRRMADGDSEPEGAKEGRTVRDFSEIRSRKEMLDGSVQWREWASWDTKEYRTAYEKYLRGSKVAVMDLGKIGMEHQEFRALQADSDIYGGYAVAPQQVVSGILMALDNMLFMRRLGTVFSVPMAQSLGQISLDADPADPAWTAEIGSASKDSTMSFGKRELNPHQLTKLIKISNKLIRQSVISISGLVQNRLAYKFGTTEENVFLNGTGAQQPLGIFTASNDGITTSQDVTCTNATDPTTTFNFDDLKDLVYNLPKQYRNAATGWVVHRDFVKMASKIKDGNDNYVWQQSVVAGDPDRLLNYPVYESEYAPNTFTTGLYIAVLGDFSKYYIADALNLQIQVVDQLYAATNQTGYIGRKETDGMPALAAAFRRLKLGT